MIRNLAILLTLTALTSGCDLGSRLTITSPDGEDLMGWPSMDDPGETPTTRDPEDLDDVVDSLEIDPARVTLHRLNRAEYNNAVRDLLGDTSRPADNFPDDDFGYGFNNIADVLSISPLHVEMYAQAAETLVDTAMAVSAASTTQRFEAEDVGSTVGTASGDVWNLYSNGEITTLVTFPADGEYRILVRAAQQAAGPEDAQMTVRVGAENHAFTVSSTSQADHELTTTVSAGTTPVAIVFENDFYDPNAGADRNLLVDYLLVEGPLGAVGDVSAARAAIVDCDPVTDEAGCTDQVIRNFGKRAWRRPLADDEVTRLAQFITLAKTEGDDWEVGIRLAMQAILISPHFLFRVERDPDLDSPEPHLLNDYELASRLSFFIWSSIPDDELLAAADAGTLQQEDVLAAQVGRMLNDPRADALVDNFATQWLFIDVVREANPDYTQFPDFDAELQEAMRTETRMFVAELLTENHSIDTLLLADFTYLNERLAEHYEIPGVTGADFRRVALSGEARRGLLGQASLLTSLSYPTRTSPVRRGEWVLSNLLCSEPPAPPAGVESLPETQPAGTTLREQMEQHSTDPACAACHRLMDPIGFGMEHYDAIGAWRDLDNGAPVDSAGELPDGTAFSGAYELAEILTGGEQYHECAAEKLLTYALGRGTEYWDKPQLVDIVGRTRANGGGFRDMIREIALSPAFRMRRGGELPE